jgi:hypothetical protein
MNAELEAILKAFDTFMQARGETAESVRMIYESRLEDVLQKHPGISKERLEQAIRKKYLQWLRQRAALRPFRQKLEIVKVIFPPAPAQIYFRHAKFFLPARTGNG